MSSVSATDSSAAATTADGAAADGVAADGAAARHWRSTDTEVRILQTVQATAGAVPAATKIARGMSHFGEHALGWIAIGAAGALVDRPRRRKWASVAVGAFGAHAASVVIKRVVRRPRPVDPTVQVNVSTPSRLSFPSSHVTSTTAAAVLLARTTGLPFPAVLVPPMMLSRLVLGVHYPTDVLAGAALGAASAAVVARAETKWGDR